jgi:hypothetical protein
VTARSRRINFSDDAANVPVVRAAIGPSADRGATASAVIGEMELVRPDGRRAMRRISARSCADATDALGLVIALTLDPAAIAPVESPNQGPSTTTARAAAATPRTAPALQTATATATGAAPPETPRRRQQVPAAQAPAAVAAAEAPVTVVPILAPLRFALGVGGQMVSGPAPDALWGVSIEAAAYWDRNALWSPALIVSAMHTATGDLVESGGTAAFTLDAVTVDACPSRLTVAGADARLCATASAGRLLAEGSDTFSPASVTRLVAAAGGAASLDLGLGRFQLSARFGAAASLVRDAFQFAPLVFHRVASVTLTASLGVGLRFP